MSTHVNNKISNMSAGWKRTVHKQGERLEDGSDRSSVFLCSEHSDNMETRIKRQVSLRQPTETMWKEFGRGPCMGASIINCSDKMEARFGSLVKSQPGKLRQCGRTFGRPVNLCQAHSDDCATPCPRQVAHCDRSCMWPEMLDYELGKLAVIKISQHENIVDSDIDMVD